MRIVISGGGTGGHIFPAIAIANGIKEQFPDANILFVGAEGRMEMQRVPKAGYEIVALPIAGIQRKLTLKNLSLPFKIWRSMSKAFGIIKSFKPEVVVGVGGYASGPIVYAAQRKGIPSVLQEQNSYAGLTNKFLSKRATKICVAYDNMGNYFPSDKIVLTGNPIRQELKNIKLSKSDAITHFGLQPNKKTVLVVGGSLGAKSLNEAVTLSYNFLKNNQDVQMIWQVGKTHITTYKNHPVAQLENVNCLEFIDKMDHAYQAADVMVCRAGASTISEICLLGKASLLVPSPHVAEDHQTKNAQALVEKQAAMMVHENQIGNEFVSKIKELLSNPEKIKELEKNAKKLAKPDAVKDIVEVINSVKL